MRKLLLSLACVAISMAASAQTAKIMMDKTMTMKSLSQEKPVLVAAKDIAKAPKKSALNGVYYKTPEGCMWLAAERPLYSYGLPYMIVAPWKDWTLTNMGTTKAGDWSIAIADTAFNINQYADVENNLVYGYAGGIGGYYGITYTEGDVAYIPSTLNQDGTVAGTCINLVDGIGFHTFFTTNVGDPSYYGGGSLDNGNLYGAGSYTYVDENKNPTGETATSVEVIHTSPKPMSPLYVEGITVWGKTRDSSLPAVSDKTLTLAIFNTESDSEEPVYVLTCTPDECVLDRESGSSAFYQVNFTMKVLDEISGEEIISPLVIDFPSEIHIIGFDQEGVNLGFLGTDVQEEFLSENLNENNTFFALRNDNTGEVTYRRYLNTVLCLGFWSMFDVIEVLDAAESTTGEIVENVNGIVVSNDGQECGNVVFSDIKGVEVYTAMDWTDAESGEEYYWSDDMYDYEWIQNLTATPVTYSDGSEASGRSYVGVVCDALPEGVTGRWACIHLNGRGVTSGDVFVLQGDITMEQAMAEYAALSIKNVTASNKAANSSARYNLAGQKVSKDFRGITISNGKKFIQK